MAGPDPRAALALRRWMVGVLDPGTPPPSPDATPEAWAWFLEVEGCSLVAREALEDVALSPAVRSAVDARAEAEARRFLSARGLLRRASRAAGASGVRVVVLKGGVAAARDAPIGMEDVDLLVDPADHAAFDAALAAEGLERPPGAGRDTWQRLAPGELPVDLHPTIRFLPDAAGALARAIPLDGAPGLWRLDPADHLRHLLVHSVVHHPERRGRIRDLLLIAREIEWTGAPPSTEWIAGHAEGEPMRAVLDTAREIARGDPVDDRLEGVALDRYVALARTRPLLRLPGGRTLAGRVVRSVCARRSWREEAGTIAWTALPENPDLPHLVALGRRAPQLALPVGAGLRGAAFVTVRALAAVSRRSASRAGADGRSSGPDRG